MPVQTKSVAAFGLAFILLTGASFTSCVALLKFKRSSQWVNHTNQVLAQTEMVFSEVKDAETGQRGYLLTRKSRYLQPYYSAVYRTPENLQTLRQLTSDNLNQQKRIQQLQLLIDAKFAELKQTIDLDRTQGVAAALAVVQTDEGQFLMDQIRELVRSIELEETTLLRQRIEQANQDANAAIASVVLLSLLTIGLAGGAVRRMVYYIATLEQMGARLQSFNDELDQQVQARTQALLSSNAALQAEIQERQQIEAALRESEQQFRSTFNQAAVGIAHVSPEGNWLQVNERLCEIVGYSREELLQKTFQDITYPDDLNIDLDYVQQMLANEIQIYSLEKRYICKDQSLIWINLTVSLVRASDGSPKYFISVVEDISQRQQAEESIRQLNVTLEQRVIERTAQLSEVNQELRAFTSTISHDLRSPLTTMKGLAQALLEDYGKDLGEEGYTYTQLIWNAAQHMDELTQDLLIYSRLSQSQIELQSIDLNQLMRQILRQMQPELQASHAQVNVNFPLPEVVAHPTLLTQVLTNLLTNAIKFVASGVSPQVQVWSEEQGDWVRLWVADNGIGIEPEDQERIFGVFERLHSIDVYPGTGIGLAIVRRGMERMRGRVGIESQFGQGSRFWLELRSATGNQQFVKG